MALKTAKSEHSDGIETTIPSPEMLKCDEIRKKRFYRRMPKNRI